MAADARRGNHEAGWPVHECSSRLRLTCPLLLRLVMSCASVSPASERLPEMRPLFSTGLLSRPCWLVTERGKQALCGEASSIGQVPPPPDGGQVAIFGH